MLNCYLIVKVFKIIPRICHKDRRSVGPFNFLVGFEGYVILNVSGDQERD